jgi:hypothetical protein
MAMERAPVPRDPIQLAKPIGDIATGVLNQSHRCGPVYGKPYI